MFSRLVCGLLMALSLLLSAVVSTHAADAPAKAAIPNATAQAAALKVVHEIYQGQYADGTVAARAKLANDLLDEAQKTSDDPAARYVLLREARDLAVQAGDVPVAFAAIDQMDKNYAIDAAGMKMALLTPLAQRTADNDLPLVVSAGLDLVEQFSAADDFANARKLVVVLTPLVARARDDAARERLGAVQFTLTEYERARGAIDALKADPKNAVASQAVGRFYCFAKGDWAKGLPLLANAEDPKLKALAEADLANPAEALKKKAVGDGWYEWAEGQLPELRVRVWLHAADWYRKAQPDLAGLAKSVVDKRLENIAAVGGVRTDVWIDLLKVLDPERDALEGKWAFAKGSLACAEGNSRRIALPATTEGPYELQLKFTRTSSDSGVGICFPAGKAQGCLMIASRVGRTYLSRSDQESKTSQPALEGAKLENNHEYTLALHVAPDGPNVTIATELDGKPYLQYKGPQAPLGMPHDWKLRHGSMLAITAGQSDLAISQLRLRPGRENGLSGALRWEFGRFKVLQKTAGEVKMQDMSGFAASKWDDGDQLWWTGTKPGSAMKLAVPIVQDGTYQLAIALTKASNYAIVQLYFDGQKVGPPADLFDKQVIRTDLTALGRFKLKAGEHALGVEIVGSNPRAQHDCMFGIDTLRVIPVP